MNSTNDTTLLDLVATLWRQATAVNQTNIELRKELDNTRAQLADAQLKLAEKAKQDA